MSMTRGEAIDWFEQVRDIAKRNLGEKWTRGCEKHYQLKVDLAEAALTALRGPTREMVERMFPGCEKCKSVCHRCLNYPVALYPKACRTCVEHSNYESASNFCEECGKPLTDEAVQMVMERLEALNDGESD